MESGATFSEDRVYRYSLWRKWDASQLAIAFIGLNPSTATEVEDDPTVRRCIGYAKAWGYGAMFMLNLFAYRSTDPRKLREVADPVGPENDFEILKAVVDKSHSAIACWGNHGALYGRGRAVHKMLAHRLRCFGLTAAQQPKHPLYLPKDARVVPFKP